MPPSILKIFILILVTGCGRVTSSFGKNPLSAIQSGSNSARLAWNPSTKDDGSLDETVIGYRIHYGSSSRTYNNAVDVNTTPEAEVRNLPLGVNFFSVTAINSDGESDFSNEISITLN